MDPSMIAPPVHLVATTGREALEAPCLFCMPIEGNGMSRGSMPELHYGNFVATVARLARNTFPAGGNTVSIN